MLALARALSQMRHPALREAVSAYDSVLLVYDPLQLDWRGLADLVARAAVAAAELPPAAGRRVDLPVLYGGEAGPDLPGVAAHTGLPPEEVIRRHAAGEYRVYALGFSPGFCYLGGLDPALATPRHATPRVRVPGGAVGIAGEQTGIYPRESPGGWQVIGRTPARLFDPGRSPPALLAPGDTAVFRPVSAAEFERLAAKAADRPAPVPDPAAGEPDGTGPGLKVLEPGLVTTVQDLGRWGCQSLGVPVSGAADFRALAAGNWLVGNPTEAAALEFALLGPTLEFLTPAAFCLAGATFDAQLVPAGGGSPRPVPPHAALLAGPGDVLRTGPARAGCRGYLCVAGGIAVPPVLGSRSTDLLGRLGPLGGRPLAAGDVLPLGWPVLPPADLAGRALPAELMPPPPAQLTVRAVLGPQAEAFTREGVAAFLASPYTVGGQSDRQGLRLSGPPVTQRAGADILSQGLALGAVQVPADGQPLLLLAGRHTMGGYAQVAVAVGADAARAAQLRPGDQVRFRAVTVAEAHAVARAEARRMAEMQRFLRGTAAMVTGRAAPGAAAGLAPDPVPGPRPGPRATRVVEVRSRLAPADSTAGAGHAAGPGLPRDGGTGPATPPGRRMTVRLSGREFDVLVEEESPEALP